MHRIFGKTVLKKKSQCNVNHYFILTELLSLIILVLHLWLDSLLHLLISCYRTGFTSMVKCLITQCHADPNCTSENGSTPLSLTQDTQIIRLLLQHGAVATDLYKCSLLLPDGSPREAAQSTISLFMVGDKGAGKSTLTKALSTERASIVRWTGRLSKVSGVKKKTAGIECHTIHSSRIGHFTIYDLAGHREFHNSHDTVIRSSISGPSSGMFLFVIDLTPSLDDLKRTVSYWLSFIQNQVSIEPSSELVSKPYLLAVGSHADSVKSELELKEKQSIVQSLCKETENINFVDYVTVDCRYSESQSLTRLRAHMLQTHDTLQETIPVVTFRDHCFHVYLVSECGNQPGMQLSSLMKAIESSPFTSKDFLPQTLQALHDACNIINKRGVMLYIQTQSIESSWIIIDKDMLLREINGSIFAPDDFTEHKALTHTGVVPFSKIASVFKKFDTQLIIDFSIHMEFCREMTAEDGLKLVTQTHPKYKEEHHFLFPALTPLIPPPDLWQPNPNINYSEYSSCWILQCHEHHHYFTSRFNEVLLLRIAFTHAFPVESDKVDHAIPALQQACTIWRRGIKWTTCSFIDALIEMTDERVVLLLRCKKGNELQLVKLRAQVIAEIQSVKKEFCNNVATVEKFVPNPQYPINLKLSVSLHKLAHSISRHEEAVLLSVDIPLDITQLVFFEPYMFCNPQCLVDLFCKDLVSCYVSPQFIECISSNISCVDDFCTLLNVPLHKVAVASSSSDYDKAVRMFLEWQTQSDGTYQCLRQYMDKYSIFSGRNILVSYLIYGGMFCL